MDTQLVQQLIEASRNAMANSYCPYSKFPVGSAILCQDGSIYTGCNVENAAYTGAICAERTAFVKAISDGHRKFKAVVVSSNLEDFCTPCGSCRQFMVEFGTDMLIILTKPNGQHACHSLDELLPKSFGPSNLDDYHKAATAIQKN